MGVSPLVGPGNNTRCSGGVCRAAPGEGGDLRDDETGGLCCSGRSRGGGGGAGDPGRRGLHRGRNRRLLAGGQDDVRGRCRQRGRSRRRQPGGYAAVRGGSWALHLNQNPPGLSWVRFRSLPWKTKKGIFIFPSIIRG